MTLKTWLLFLVMETALSLSPGPAVFYTVSQGVRDSFWRQGMQSGLKGVYDCIKAFSETDFTEDLGKFDVPTLILHGDDDQIVPIAGSALLAAKLIKNATLKIYPGGSHGICATEKDKVNADLLAFIKE